MKRPSVWVRPIDCSLKFSLPNRLPAFLESFLDCLGQLVGTDDKISSTSKTLFESLARTFIFKHKNIQDINISTFSYLHINNIITLKGRFVKAVFVAIRQLSKTDRVLEVY